MITVIDYGLGNAHAFYNIFKMLNIDCKKSSSVRDLEDADKLILPGVGSFDWAIERLEKSGLRDSLDKQVLTKKKPVLGVCVGMQIMGNASEEGSKKGLGWINADVNKLYCNSNKTKDLILPHMGWNNVEEVKDNNLLKGIDILEFYFLHSYYMLPSNKENIIGNTLYGIKFASAIQYENIFGTQFHPEKSHGNGIKVLKNFAELNID